MPSDTDDTPCISICEMDARSQLCKGCGRTLDEIARWGLMQGAERRAVMAELAQRMRDAGLPLPQRPLPP